MTNIHTTQTPCQIVIPMDFITAFKHELERQGIAIIKTRRPRELNADPNVNMDDINHIMDMNYGRYGKNFTGPVMVTANGDYDGMLAVARRLARDTAQPIISEPMDADELKEIETATRRKEV